MNPQALTISQNLKDALDAVGRTGTPLSKRGGFVWHDVEQRMPEWFALRLGIPTASCFHKLITPAKLKISEQRYKYRNQLLAEWITGIPIEDFQSKSMERGTENEDRARNAYEMITDTETSRPGFFTAYDGNAGASPDALIGTAGDVELKCVEIQTQVGYALSGIEDDHKIQMQGRLLIEEREWCDLFSFNERLPLDPIKTYRNEETIKAIDAALRQFIDELLAAREKLTREYGPFVRADPAQAAEVLKGDFDLTDADADAIFAASREARQ